jgi:hypothetical protein
LISLRDFLAIAAVVVVVVSLERLNLMAEEEEAEI